MQINFNNLKKCIDVSCETLDKLIIYSELLHSWQKKMNLVSNNSLIEAENRHFIDSAQLYKFCNKINGNILDFGSGAGFPGAVLSMFGLPNIILIESNKKKCSFLKNLKKETNSNFEIINSRIEDLEFLQSSLIVSRALTSTKNLISLSIDYMLKSNEINTEEEAIKNLPNLLFLKGKNYFEELKDIPDKWKINFSFYSSITSAESKILMYNKENL